MLRIGLLALLGMFLVAAIAAAQDRQEVLGIGVVLDRDGQPAANVEVRGLWQPAEGAPFGPSLVVTHTDAQGKYMVPLPAGEVRSIELLAYGGNDLAAYHEQSVVSVDQEIPEPVKLKLKPYRPFRVQVKDQDGKPLAGVNVSSVPDFLGPFTKQTDANGEAEVIVINRSGPFGLFVIVAWDQQLGLDYIHVSSYSRKSKNHISLYYSDVVQFELHPWHQKTIRLVDLDKNPIPNALLIPNYFWLPDGYHYLANCSLWGAVTDGDGIAQLRYPQSSHNLNFDIVVPGFLADQIMPLDEHFKDELVLLSVMTVSGVVTDADGQPAEGVPVELRGDGPRIRGYLETTMTNDQGLFQAEVPEESYCVIRAITKLSASPIEKRVIRRNHSVASVKLSLQPMLEVSGIGIDRHGKPMIEANVWFTRNSDDLISYFKNLPAEQRLSSPTAAQEELTYFFGDAGKTNVIGEFYHLLPPGNYIASVGVRGKDQSFTLSPEEPIELKLKNETHPRDVLKVRVVSAEQPDKAIGGAVVSYAAVALDENLQKLFSGDHGCNYNNEGQADFKVYDCPYVLTAESQDEKLQAFQYVPAGVLDVTLKLEPTASIQGKLATADGSPAAGQKITADIDLQVGADVLCPVGQQTAVANKEGLFTIEMLYPGQKYNVHLVNESETDQKASLTEPIFSYTPEQGDVKKDIGTFKLEPREND